MSNCIELEGTFAFTGDEQAAEKYRTLMDSVKDLKQPSFDDGRDTEQLNRDIAWWFLTKGGSRLHENLGGPPEHLYTVIVTGVGANSGHTNRSLRATLMCLSRLGFRGVSSTIARGEHDGYTRPFRETFTLDGKGEAVPS